MKQLKALLGLVNWRYAFGELALIVIGITIALGFNSWYAGIDDRRDEIAYLRRIRLSLEDDLRRLSNSERGITEAVERFGALNEHLQKKLPYSEELEPTFFETREFRILSLNTAVFDSLRARGLDLISNDELQFALIDLYDNTETFLTRQQAYDEQLAFTVVGPYLYLKFAFGQRKAKPYDYDALLDDVYFQNLVNVRKVGYEIYTLPTWRDAMQEVEKVIAAIDSELERLD